MDDLAAAPAPPAFQYQAYGVRLTWIGDEGGMIAEGHVPFWRFVAACNHMARSDARFLNLADSRTATLDEALAFVTHCWALPVAGRGDNDWYVDFSSRVTAETPGAIPVTLYWPGT